MTDINSDCHYVIMDPRVFTKCEQDGLFAPVRMSAFVYGDWQAYTYGILFIFKPNCRNNCVLSNRTRCGELA